jgi:hypothetical protein
MKKTFKQKKFLAFIHIEKSAGTTFIHLLRKNYFLSYMDVRPLHPKSGRIFNSGDLAAYLRINPMLRCFGGHAVVPYSGLEDAFPNIRYITILRDPAKRYISQFTHLVRDNKATNNFIKFAERQDLHNFQTKKLDPAGDPDRAFMTLKNQILNVGLVEEMDTFLLRLRNVLGSDKFDPHYQIKNKAVYNDSSKKIYDTHYDLISKINEKDILLYSRVKNELIPKLNDAYGPDLGRDLESFKKTNIRTRTSVRNFIDYFVRKLYYDPVSGYIRRKNGLQSFGSYNDLRTPNS